MAPRRRKPEPWRIRSYHALIRQLRGKPLLEALHRLQNGHCAYDEDPCALLLPQAAAEALRLGIRIPRDHLIRFSTVDHILPRTLGGENSFPNLVMAAQTSNAQKGCFAPYGRWVPKVRHDPDNIERMLELVEQERWVLAMRWAADRRMTTDDVTLLIIERELKRVHSSDDFKFYDLPTAMVA